MSVTYPAVSIEGGLITRGLVRRLGEGDASVPYTSAESYGRAPGESVRKLANSSYTYLREVWTDYATFRTRGDDALSARHTRDRWLLALLGQLGYDGIKALPSGMAVDNKDFAISHEWQSVPVHLLGWGVDLDHRTPGLRGAAAAAPHSLVQQLLNRSDRHLWALLSNGQRLRLLRDSTSLVGIAYIEFDLEAIFDGGLFADFVQLYRIANATRLTVRDIEIGPASCVLEKWRSVGAEEGERALQQLRSGVEEALEILGTGFLDHPDNAYLRAAIGADWSEADFQRSLLRLVYRLLFWFVAEDRDVLLNPSATPQARRTYHDYFSARRLRDLAVHRRHSRHGDLWQQVGLLIDGLGNAGLPQLGLPGLGGLFQPGRLDGPLANTQLTNTALLTAVEALAVLPATKSRGRQRVDFRHLGSEELGSVYEGLLEVQPRWDPAARRYHLERLAGNERKTTGSYYTPSSLVECLLDSALDPLLNEATAHKTKDERVAALLDLSVCDPACGSGHFLIAAARRIAKALAAEDTGEPEPTPEAVRTATRRVIGRCIYGVDVNEMAAELAKVSLWLEAMEPGKPLGYLDTNIRVGNSLLGTTPTLLAAGIPDEAYVALEGDDRKMVAALRGHREQGDAGQLSFFAEEHVQTGNAAIAKAAAEIARAEVNDLHDVHVQKQRAAEFDAARRHAALIADAWCAAFVQHRTPALAATIITKGILERLQHDPDQLDLVPVVETVERLGAQYRFFHWHLEFPHVFRVPEIGLGAELAGWDGGFALVVGNPPWERVKLQEKEFFAANAPAIASAPNASARKKMIAALAESEAVEQRALHREWLDALRESDAVSHMLRATGRYPLAGRGDINTYAVFAEAVRSIVAASGVAGAIVPTAVATDSTTQFLFKDIVAGRHLCALLDFVTNPRIWTDVGNRRYRFAVLVTGGRRRSFERAEFATLLKHPDELPPRGARIHVGADELLLVNPNTGTSPMFASRRDAEITLGIYRRVSVLWREHDPFDNPWNVSFLRMFDMSVDSGLFRRAPQLIADGWTPDGNLFLRGAERMLPLYEAKLVHHFDHRLSCYSKRPEGSLDTELPRLTDDEKNDPTRAPIPLNWIPEHGTKDKPGVENRLAGRWKHGWLLGWRDIARSTDERTLISTVVPRTATGHKFLLALIDRQPHAALHANLSTFVLDYVARQKLSGTSMGYFIVKQLPVLRPDRYVEQPLWDRAARSMGQWITLRVLELTYTAHDLAAYARDLGDDGPPFRWVPERREMMRAELDAAYFHLYGVERDDVDYIMDTFKVVRQKDEAAHGEYRTKRLIMERYDAMASATWTGTPYQTPLDPPPGHGPRHPARTESHA